MNDISKFEIDISKEKIELWSSARIPYEPTGWKKEMRDELRVALKSSSVSQDGILHAYYASEQREYVDIENVLFYNIGAGAYSHLCPKGITFGLSRRLPIVEPAKASRFEYYQCYFLRQPTKFLPNLIKSEDIVEWSNVMGPPLKSTTKPHAFWHGIKGGNTSKHKRSEDSSPIGIQMKVHAPSGDKTNLSSAMKTMIDGILCAFHSHSGSNIEHVCEKLGKYLSLDPEEVRSLLMDSEMDVLGSRKLVGPFREGIKWNPADDRIEYAEILVGEDNPNDTWTYSGSLFELLERNESE